MVRAARRGGREERLEWAADRIKVAVVVDDDARNQLTDVLAACRACGFDVEIALMRIGVLVGSVRPANLERLQATPGVVAVEQERHVRMHSASCAAVRSKRGSF